MYWLCCPPEACERLAIQPVHERQQEVLGQVLETRRHIIALCAAVSIEVSTAVFTQGKHVRLVH